MNTTTRQRPSLETLVENGDINIPVLHPGGLESTAELARNCRVKKDTRVLDVCSGTGESACYLVQVFGAALKGIDNSPRMVAAARRKAAARNIDIEFTQGDAERLPYPNNSFEVAIAECSLCLLDKVKVLNEMVRVVEPGGYVAVHDLCWQPGTPDEMRARLAEIEGERPETLQGWQDLFEHAGLSDVRAQDRSSVMPHWLKTVNMQIGLMDRIGIYAKVAFRWGWQGISDVRDSERIFASPYLGYMTIHGRKPESKA